MIPPTQNTSGKVNSVTADNDFIFLPDKKEEELSK